MPTMSTSRGRRPAFRPNQERGAATILALFEQRLPAAGNRRTQDTPERRLVADIGLAERIHRGQRAGHLRGILAEQLDQAITGIEQYELLIVPTATWLHVCRFFIVTGLSRTPAPALRADPPAALAARGSDRAGAVWHRGPAQMAICVSCADAIRILDLELSMTQLGVVAIAESRTTRLSDCCPSGICSRLVHAFSTVSCTRDRRHAPDRRTRNVQTARKAGSNAVHLIAEI